MKIDSSEINETKATVVNLLFNYGTTIVLIINSIVLVPFYLNYMSFSEYGAWLTAIATINIIMIIDPGISSVSSQRLSQFFSEDSDKDFQSTFLSSLLIASFFTVLTFFIGLFLDPLQDGRRNKVFTKASVHPGWRQNIPPNMGYSNGF